MAFTELVFSALPTGASDLKRRHRRLIVLDNRQHLVILILETVFLARGNRNAKQSVTGG